MAAETSDFTVEYVIEQVEHIFELQDDMEQLHRKEDNLLWMLVAEAANGRNVQEQAKAMLCLEDIKSSRWYA